MSLDLYRQDREDLLDIARLSPLEALPPTFSEAFDAAVDENRQFASSAAELRNRYEVWQARLDAFEDATGEALPNPEAVPDGPNRAAVLRHIRARFDQVGKERPDLGLAFPEEEEIAAAAAGIAGDARRRRAEMEAGLQTWGSTAGFLAGDLWGAATDPVNAASMLFGAPAAAGILRTALIEGAIGLTSQAAVEAGTAGFKGQADPSYGLPDALGNIAMAGAGGAVIGGGLVAAGRGTRALVEQYRRVRGTPATRQEWDALNVLEREAEIDEANPLPGVAGEGAHREAMAKAGSDIEAGRPVDVSSIVREAQEREEIERAYQRTLQDPDGPAYDPLVRITPEDIEGVILARGGYKGLGSVEVKGSGWGLVKFIWRHGERSKKDPRLQITMEDLKAFPRVIREFESIREPGSTSRERGREWRVLLPHPEFGDRLIVFADKLMEESPDRHLVSVYVQEPGRTGHDAPLSPQKTGLPGSSSPVFEPRREEILPENILDLRSQEAGSQDISPNAGRVYTSSGRAVDVEYRVVEADDLVASHGADGSVNPAYPADLQPRDRSRVSSQTQIAEIAANLQPERLGRSPDAATGAPIVGPDGVVESGNGRVAAILRAYENAEAPKEGIPFMITQAMRRDLRERGFTNEQIATMTPAQAHEMLGGASSGGAAERYRAWVAEQFPEAAEMRRPVLVAERRTELDRVAFGREANTATAARMSPTEQARADAELIDDAVLDRMQSADVGAASNRSAVRAFLDRLPASERSGLVDRDGALNQEGRRRMEGALLGRAYGDPMIIGRIVEDTDSEIRAIGGALLDVAGPWAQMRAATARGDLAAGMDVTADLLAAVRMVAEARAAGRKVRDMLAQENMFGGLSPLGRILLGRMFRDDALSKPAGRQAIADMLRGYVGEAMKNTSAKRLIGEPLTAEQIIRGDRLAGEPQAPPARPGGPRNADEVAEAPETEEALFQEVNRLLAGREVEVPLDVWEDPRTGRVVALKRGAMELMEEADREIEMAAQVAACALGVAA